MAKKSTHKTTHKSSTVKRHNHLLKDHPHFWWLILIFLALCVFFIWKYQQNANGLMIDVVNVNPPAQQMMPAENMPATRAAY
jgi:hypothetical protein